MKILRNSLKKRRLSKGQAMAEYVMVLTILTIVSIFALQQFKIALEGYTNRVITYRTGDEGAKQ